MKASREQRRRALKRPDVLEHGAEVGGLVSRSGRTVSLDPCRTPATTDDAEDSALERFAGAFDRAW